MKELMEEMNLEEMENENGGAYLDPVTCAWLLFSCGAGGCGGYEACQLYREYCY